MVMLCRLAAVSPDRDFAWDVQTYGQHRSKRPVQALKSADCCRLLLMLLRTYDRSRQGGSVRLAIITAPGLFFMASLASSTAAQLADLAEDDTGGARSEPA